MGVFGQTFGVFSSKNLITISSHIIFVNSKTDFPAPVSGVITLQANKTYIVTTSIDLLGDRLVTSGVCNLFGLSSEVSFLTSNGLGAGIPLLTSEYTTVLENITINDVDTAVSIDGTSRIVALDWENVNFLNVPNVGIIDSSENFIYETGAFLNSKGLKFTGTIGTVGVFNSLFSGDGVSGNIIELDANCIVNRRFRIIYSSIIAFSNTTGIHVNISATIPIEGYILDTVNFSGGGTYLSGIDETSNDSLFTNCVGINNTFVNGQMYMQANATATTISNTTDFFKVAGTTTPSADNSKYTSTNNRLTNDAVIERKYLVICNLSFNSGATNVCEFGFFDSRVNDVRIPSRTKSTANAGGRAENISFQCVINHSQGDYIEVWAKNTSATTNITVTEMNVTITQL